VPKLTRDLAASVEKAASDGGSFEPLEPGEYRCRLHEVTAKNAASGNPMWVWVFETVDKPRGRRLWVNTVLTDAALWKVGEVFTAFGVPTDTDTDEMIGATALLEVALREIGAGARKGQMGNDVTRVRVDRDASAVRVPGANFDGPAEPGGVQDRPKAVASTRRDDF
jgi:hypothetical protein